MILLLCLAIVVASLLGGILPLATVLTHTRLQLYLSLSAGAMLGAAFFHMLPEAVELGSAGTLRWAAGGLLALFFVERFFAYHHHESLEITEKGCEGHDHDHSHAHEHSHDKASPAVSAPESKGIALHWGAAACGLALHTLIGGIALASAVVADRTSAGRLGSAAWGVFLATLIHKPADALTITSLMLHAGMKRSTAHLVNLGFSLMIPVGAGLFLLGSKLTGGQQGSAQGLTAATLAFSAGTFLCIALSDLLPELQFHKHDRVKLSLALLAGLGIMALAGTVEISH